MSNKKQFQFIWGCVAIIPMAAITSVIGKSIHADTRIILWIQIPTLALQLFSLFMQIRCKR